MKVYLSNVNPDNLFANEILTCTISEKTDEGYIINIMGKEVFAKSDLILKPNQLINVKVDRNLPTQLTLKVLPDIETSVESNTSTYAANFNKQLPMTILSKLNLPMTDNRLKLLSEILNSLSKNPQNPDLEKTKSELDIIKKFQENIKKNPSPKSIKKLLKFASSFDKNEDKNSKLASKTSIAQEPIYSNKTISETPTGIEKLQKYISQKLKENIEKEPQLFKKAVAIKTLNIAYSNEKIDTRFIFLPLLTNKPAYIKLSKNKKESHRKSRNKDDDNPIKLSVLLDTRNLGKVLADFTYEKNGILPSLTFEKKNSLEYVKRISHSSNDSLLKSIHFSLKKISTKDFFFQGLETKKIPRKVNIKI